MGHNLVTNASLLADINILRDEDGNDVIWKVDGLMT